MASKVAESKQTQSKHTKQKKCMSSVQENTSTNGTSFITGFQSHLKSVDFWVKDRVLWF